MLSTIPPKPKLSIYCQIQKTWISTSHFSEPEYETQ